MLFSVYSLLMRMLPAHFDGLFGQEVLEERGVWLALDPHGYPVLLLTPLQADERSDIELRALSVRFARACEITTENGRLVSGTFTIVRLEENDPDLVRLFLKLLEEAFCTSRRPPTNRSIAEQILEIAEIFRQIEISSKDIVGLWGELSVIKAATSYENAVRCWCQSRTAKYDFVGDGFAIEVKATLKPRRIHRFGLDQLRPVEHGLTVFIASAQLIQAPGGKAVFELIDDILNNISEPELRSAFLKACVLKGGDDVYKSDARFQFLSQDTGIIYFKAADIPVPQIETDAPISNVKFDVCLDSLPRQNDSIYAQVSNIKM